jgi:hypothetical protein
MALLPGWSPYYGKKNLCSRLPLKYDSRSIHDGISASLIAAPNAVIVVDDKVKASPLCPVLEDYLWPDSERTTHVFYGFELLRIGAFTAGCVVFASLMLIGRSPISFN